MRFLLPACLLAAPVAAAPLTTVEQLVAAAASPGTVIELAPGTFRLAGPLDLKAGTTLRGAGIGRTILTHAPEWHAAVATLPDPETNRPKFDRSGYLVRLEDRAAGIVLRDLTLTGPQVHGAVFGSGNADVLLHDLHVEDFLASGIRSYAWERASIHDCTFVDAGRRWQKGRPGLEGGITGGAIFAIWIRDSEIRNNRFLRTKSAPHDHFYGIKGRQGKRLRIHHNTIEVNFSIEFPFENDEDIEISHNVLLGTVSIPKHGGGPVPASGRTFHLHHNLFRSSYAIEFPRNGVEIDHNLFDFDPGRDGGNLISGFGNAPASGPASFHHNLVRHPGRGIIWIQGPFSRLDVHHNHILALPTVTPRTEGLFAFHRDSDSATLRLTDNVVECRDLARPLLRHAPGPGLVIENNELIHVSDAAQLANPPTGRPRGLEAPLRFTCGVNGEVTVDGWNVTGANPLPASVP
jgi:nitrous oxidase accessory protein